MQIFNSTIQTLTHSLDYSAKKNQAISNNIANVDTPNYKVKHVQFKQLLAQKSAQQGNERSHPLHFNFTSSNQSYAVHTDKNSTYNHNGNNVDVEKEMSALAENQIYYQSLVDRLNGKFGLLQTVIKGGR